MTPEFSRIVRLDQMDSDSLNIELTATPVECAALAKRFGLVAIGALSARARLKRLKKGQSADLKGVLSTDVVQSCVVTLDPVPAHVEAEFHVRFVPAAALETPLDEIVVDLEEDDLEPIENGVVDLGEAVAQHLSLALDPYPRAPGAALPDAPVEVAPEPKRPNPFTVLKHKG